MLGTSVLVLPYHNPVELAKYAASLDQISGGRVTLGVGVGAMTEEFDALGISMRDRASLTNECIAIMKELWTSPSPTYESRRWKFTDLLFSPKPVQKPHIPLWIGGSSPGAMRRAALRGDGWHPTGLSPEEFSIGRREIEEMATAAGRAPESLAMSLRIEVEAHGGPSSSRSAGRARISGDDPDAIAASLAAYETAGVQHVVLALNTGDVDTITRLMETIAREVIPRFL
jgi:probable F420-dependent oxidoreductase